MSNVDAFVNALGLTLVQFLWQAAAIWAVVALTLRAMRQVSAQARYLVCSVGMLALTIAPIATFALTLGMTDRLTPLAMTLPSAFPVEGSQPFAFALTTDESRPATWLPIVVVAWAVGVLLLTIRMLMSWRAVSLLRTHLSAGDGIWSARAQAIAGRLGLVRPFAVVECARVDVPAVVGWLRPVVLIPVGTLGGLSPVQVDAILAHELAHIRRHDYLVNALQHLVETLFFYHPAVWWMSSRMRIEREHCCDEIAIEVTHDRVAYVRALVALEEGRVPAAAVAVNGGRLVERVRRILNLSPQPHARVPRVIAAVLITVVIIAMTVVTGATRPAPAATRTSPPASATPQVELPATTRRAASDATAISLDQVRARPAEPPAQERDSAAVRAQIGVVESQLANAVAGTDQATVERLLGNSFVQMEPHGEFLTKDQFLAGLPTRRRTSTSFEQLTIRVNGGNAIVTGVEIGRLPHGLSSQHFTRVWTRTPEGGWRVASIAITNREFIHDPPPATTQTTRVDDTGFGAGAARVGGAIQEPAKIYNVSPVYPAIAKAAGVQGVVIIETVINPDGRVQDARILRSVPMLDQAALDAVMQWRYASPAQPVRMTVTVNFGLR